MKGWEDWEEKEEGGEIVWINSKTEERAYRKPRCLEAKQDYDYKKNKEREERKKEKDKIKAGRKKGGRGKQIT